MKSSLKNFKKVYLIEMLYKLENPIMLKDITNKFS